MSEAGRTLFAASRASKGSVNDADRLRKYLGRFGLTFAAIHNASKDADSTGPTLAKARVRHADEIGLALLPDSVQRRSETQPSLAVRG
jgi:hypothetical protein